MYSTKDLLNKKTRPTKERFGLWVLEQNLKNNNLVTNIGNINYCKGEKKVRSLLPITDVFCDNIILVKLCDITDCENTNNKIVHAKKETYGSFNAYLRGVFSNYSLNQYSVQAKLPYLLNNSSRAQCAGLRQVICKDMDKIQARYKEPVAIPYKIELARVKLEDLLKELPDILEKLELEMYYLLDLDITIDLAGVFNKEEMCEYLTNNFNFCYQDDFQENCNVIVDNDKTVGKDCLTWLCSNSRVKIYNKFICQITSPGVSRQIGNHIVSFVNCPEKRLKETFSSELAKENGITRLEATIYNYSTNYGKEFDPIHDCLRLLENNKKYLANAPFYCVPLSKMWTKLTDCLENSCCLVFNDLLQYVYWGNTNTKKLTGIQFKLPQDSYKREKLIRYALSAFSFNCLPVNYLEVIADGEDQDRVSVKHKCYIKSGATLFTKRNTPFSVIAKHLNLQELGLVDTCNVSPKILRKQAFIKSKLYPYVIKEIDPITKPYLLPTRKRKLELEDTICNKKQKLEIINSIKEEYKAQLAKEKEIKEYGETLKNYFVRRWSGLGTSGNYKVYAFVINDKNKFTYVGVLAEKDGVKTVYSIKGLFKNLFIELNKNRQDFLVLPYRAHNNKFNLDAVYLPTKEPIATFNTNGTTTYIGQSVPKIENLKTYNTVWDTTKVYVCNQEDVETGNAALMQEIKGAVKVKDCSRLEELEEGSEMLIVGIKEIPHRGKTRYALNFDNFCNLYVSNYWLEIELDGGNVDLSCKTKIKLGELKTTPSKHKERLVFWT